MLAKKKEVKSMKKVIGVAVALMLVIATVTGAMAFGPGGCMGQGPGNCPQMGAAMTPEQSQKFAQFQQDTLALRQQMMQYKTELMTLRAQQNPDWKAIADKQKQMVDVRTEIQKKRAAAGLPGAPGCGNCGMGMRGMGNCGMGM
jgi:Spy/CpxP family protein refolding chaperone